MSHPSRMVASNRGLPTAQSLVEWQDFALRFLDVSGSLLLLLFFLPLLAVLALVVKVTDGGPALFAQERVGQNGRPFRCLKFRSMRVDAAERLDRLLAEDAAARAEWEANHKLATDPRVTRIGGVLRALSLDELPQLFNVLNGSMSLVGPRPITAGELKRYGEHARLYLKVRPGLTGLWQVSGRSALSYDQRVELDSQFVLTLSVATYLGILLKTPAAVLFCRGAV